MNRYELPHRVTTAPTLLEMGGRSNPGGGHTVFGRNLGGGDTIFGRQNPGGMQSVFGQAMTPAEILEARRKMLAAQQVGPATPPTPPPGSPGTQPPTTETEQAGDKPIPTWAYAAGGVAVLGLGYLLFFHKKGRRG